MQPPIYRYIFSPDVSLEEIAATLLLAVWGCESLHGESQTRLDAAHYFDSDKRVCVIDAATPVGQDFNRLFLGFVRREFGEDSFQVQRVAAISPSDPGVPAA